MDKTRFFKYTGAPALTRGQYGENLTDGYELNHDGAIHFFDSTFGDFVWGAVDWGIQSGQWVEVKQETKND